MTSIAKLAEQFVTKPDSVVIKDIEKLLSLFGYALRKSSGSHRVFHKPGASPITVPTMGKKIKKEYIEMLMEKLNLEEYLEKK